MPPESLPLDRKDFFKERKHERSEFAGPSSRWRDSSNHGSREFNRWGSGDFRRPSGHGRQGGWQLFSDEYGHGYVPSMSFGNKIVDNASSRSSAPHGDGKYARNGRENRSFSQRDWKGHSWSTSNGSNINCGRLQHDLNYDQKSVHEMMIYPSHSHSHPDFVNSRDKVKGQHDKINDVNVLGTNHRRGREYSLSSSSWKPLKWTRSGGLSSRSSISGHSSSTKSFDALNSDEAKSEVAMKNVTQDMSPSADPAEWEMSAPPSDETTVRKKPRLGWGEGLAKYEKKKVEAPDSAGFSNVFAESTHSLSSSLVERGPRGSGFSDCTSPATPSSVVYGSSPDGDDKLTGKAANIDNDVSNLHGSPGSDFQSQYEGPSSNLEKLDNFPIANLESPLNQQLQSNDDSNSADSCFMSSTEMNKLLTYKNEISKVLETTESEIDLLENELKGLRSENKGCFSYPSVARALLVGDKYIEQHKDASSLIPQPSVPEVDTSGGSVSEKLVICLHDSKELHADIKGKDIDMSGRYGAMDSINVREKPISSYNAEDNIVSSADSGILVENEAFTKAFISNDVHEHSDKGYNVFDLILASNKESAYRAAEALNSLLPANEQKVDIWSSNASCPTNQLLIEERFAQRRHLLRFKERAITLKFRAFQSFWKENSLVPPVRKLRSKSQKKSQSSLGPNQSGYQKNRSSVRFHLPSSAGNLNPVPTAEILKHMGKQLSNSSQVTLDRKTLKMPALILDPKDKMASRFNSKNGLVEDPFAVEKERMMINPWTAEEKDVFLDKLASFGKDFKKISSFLNHKTTADCVEFYYKNHKSDCFKKTKKLEFGKKVKSSTSAYMVTAEKKWNLEMNTASLDMLGAASVMTARAYKNVGKQHKFSSRMGGRTEHRTSQVDCLSEKTECSDILGNEREQVAADVLAGICGSLSSEAMGSCVTNNLDRREGSRELKCKKGSATVLRWRMKAKVPQNVDDEICSGESCGEMESPYWTDGERSLFMEAVTAYGKNFSMISSYVKTKSTEQCKVFFSKARKCLGLDLICSGNKKAPGNNENANRGSNVGSGDTKEACMLASNPVPSSEGGCKMVEDFPPKFVSSLNGEESDPLKTVNMQTTHQELQENIPFSKISHSDAAVAAVDSLVSDACSRKDSPRLASDKNDLPHNQKPAAVCMNVENTEQGSSAPVASSVENTAIGYSRPRLDVFPGTKGSDVVTKGKQERRNVDASDQNDVLLDTSKSSRVNLLPQDEQRYHVRLSLSDSERSYRNGDVKLFGQILTHPSVQKSKSGSDENGIRTKLQLHRKFKRRLKINHGDLVTSKLDLNNTPDKGDVPSRTYRNGIRSGISSLPDPAHLLAQYPPAFDHSSTTTSGNQQLQPIGNDQESKGSPQIFEVSCSSGRLTDHDKELSPQRNNVSELTSALQ